MSARPKPSRPTVSLSVEQLENRELLASGPFNTPLFYAEIRQLMRSNDLPQISIAAHVGSRNFTFTFTNRAFSQFAQGQIPTTTSNSLFRIASVSKVFTAVAIMKEVQDGQLSLSDRAFQILGYFNADGQPIRQTGRDPVTGDPVSFLPSQKLYSITIQSLLNMSSGLPQSVPVESATFPVPPGKSHLLAPVIYVPGNYAALAYSSAPPYKAPANVFQQLAFYVYTFTANRLALLDPGTYAYNDTGYALLGAVAATVSEQDYHLPYNFFLKRDILGPLGISAPLEKPLPNTPMAAIARTRAIARYPTEVFYYSNASEPPQTSVFPNPNVTNPPFAPKRLVPQPYGGELFWQSHFGEGGIVANPLALTTLFSRLFEAYQGNDTAPLTPATVRLMVDASEGTPVPGTDSWWGLGWQVFAAPNTTDQPGAWEKNGGLPGTSSLLFQGADGTTWAYILNENDGDAVGAADQPFEHQMKAYIQAAIAAWTADHAPLSFERDP
jgi:CubicO group peptidase (beta-lactamase class C family)